MAESSTSSLDDKCSTQYLQEVFEALHRRGVWRIMNLDDYKDTMKSNDTHSNQVLLQPSLFICLCPCETIFNNVSAIGCPAEPSDGIPHF